MDVAAATPQYSCPETLSATIFKWAKPLRPKRLSHELKADFADWPTLWTDVDRPEQFRLQERELGHPRIALHRDEEDPVGAHANWLSSGGDLGTDQRAPACHHGTLRDALIQTGFLQVLSERIGNARRPSRSPTASHVYQLPVTGYRLPVTGNR